MTSEPIEAPFSPSAAALAQRLCTDLERGLTSSEAAARLRRDGPNQLQEAAPPSWWHQLLAQFNQLVIWILIAATILSAFLGDWLEAGAILAIILLNALLGFFQERKAEKALTSLRKLSSPTARVWRDGTLDRIAAEELVRGDLVELEAGDRVPADLRLTIAFALRLEEAALTGESVPVEKQTTAPVASDTALAERTNMAFLGTTAVAGKGRGLVTATGMQTELGRIAGFLETEECEPTPLQRRLTELGRVLIVACLVLVAIIFVLQLLRGESLAQTFLVAVSLAVAAVPEGLPAVVTIALALGLQRMVQRHALIRRLASVETLGAVTVICSDKTGTLTRNEMTVTEIVTGTKSFRVTGGGYQPEGEFLLPNDQPIAALNAPDLLQTLRIGLWCNNAQLEAPQEDEPRWHILGDPTEGALIVAARKAGLERAPESKVIDELPFDSIRKLMSIVAREGRQVFLFTKGAPETLLSRCDREQRDGQILSLGEERRREILEQSHVMAGRALRVLAFAWREASDDPASHLERELIFTGLAGMIDPPREEARVAVAKCQAAGIRPVVITGDHPATALAIARELHIARADDRAITGAELETYSDALLTARVPGISVYARVSPEHKLRVVRALKAHGEIVAMTGDGVNDAPAVKTANIGIAMGITGTDVTKEASDMVLTDDNFASIVNAVEEGRGIYDNIQESVHYLLSSNASEIALVLFAALIGWPVPLIPIQLLWINLITDGIPALALAMEKPAPDIMNRPPRPPNEPFFTRRRGARTLIHGALMASVMIGGFAYAYREAGLAYAQAAVFYITVFAQLFFSFACRSQRYTLPQLGLFSNPWLLGAIAVSGFLQLALLWFPLTRRVFFENILHFGSDWLLIFFLALIPVSLVEIGKMIGGRFSKDKTPRPKRD